MVLSVFPDTNSTIPFEEGLDNVHKTVLGWQTLCIFCTTRGSWQYWPCSVDALSWLFLGWVRWCLAPGLLLPSWELSHGPVCSFSRACGMQRAHPQPSSALAQPNPRLGWKGGQLTISLAAGERPAGQARAIPGVLREATQSHPPCCRPWQPHAGVRPDGF